MGIARLCAIALVAAMATAACSRSDKASRAAGEDTSGSAAAADREAACASAVRKGPLAWFEDDYAAALACARAAKKPLFIDLWAPWCHTCIAMKSGVFQDPGMTPLADRFVWLAINTDRESNAGVLVQFPPQVWPTFYIVSPHDEAVQARYLGAASMAQLRELLHQGEQGFLATAAGDLDPTSPLGLVREGDRAVVAEEFETAAASYRAALDRAPADWPRRPDVLVALATALYRAGEWQACADLGVAEMGRTGDSASVTDFIVNARRCVIGLEEEDRILAFHTQAAARLRALIDDTGAALSKDDRSDAMYYLRAILLDLERDDEARALAEAQRAFLDQAAAESRTAFEAMTYNWPRSEVYAFLGRATELIPVLEKSVADLPREYDPPYRLAWIYLQAGQPDQAVPWAERALSLVTGARGGRVLGLLAEIHAARGDRAAERSARERTVSLYENLPAGMKNEVSLEQARADLAALD